MRPCDLFLQQRGVLLGDHGFQADPGRVERTPDARIVFYHYSQAEALDRIFAPGGGLRARLPVADGSTTPRFAGYHLVEGLLEPLPRWLTASPYFGDLGLAMMRAYVGDVLLRIEVPDDFPDLYVADAAHNFECKHLDRRGRAALQLGYDCSTGHEVCTAEVNSYIPLTEYNGGHVAPNVKVLRRGEGIAIPREHISVAAVQPLRQ
jgi:hypothetical protein